MDINLEELDQFVLKSLWLRNHYSLLDPYDFYRFIFPVGSFERKGHPEDSRGNGLAVSIGSQRGELTVITDGLEQLPELLKKPFVVMSPLSYFGRSRKAQNALWMHALTLDIDYVDKKGLINIMHHAEGLGRTPIPTFVVNSGHGVHLYYVFDSPIPMFKKNQTELKKLKGALIEYVWNEFTSTNVDAREALGVVQGFRMVGSTSKVGMGYTVEAFRTGERVSIEYLNSFVGEFENHAILPTSTMSRDVAKEKYPEWYERRVVRGEKPGKWHVNRALYDWFKKKIKTSAAVGHRYFCLMCLAAFAAKCDISRDELYADARELQPILSALDKNGDAPFLIDEMAKALEAYNDSYINLPRATIERLSGISMPANKRNGRPREVHLGRARAVQAFDDPSGSWRYRGGAPTKQKEVQAYAAAHPDANHTQIARELGISRPTVIKWLA